MCPTITVLFSVLKDVTPFEMVCFANVDFVYICISAEGIFEELLFIERGDDEPSSPLDRSRIC